MATSPNGDPGQSYRLFFSYGSGDTYIVEQLLVPKVTASGANVFVDKGRIKYGDDFRNVIFQELSQCDELLVLLTETSIRRPWVFAEIGATLLRGERIVAVRYLRSERQLRRRGILSLLGTNKLVPIEEFDAYVDELRDRVEAHRNG